MSGKSYVCPSNTTSIAMEEPMHADGTSQTCGLNKPSMCFIEAAPNAGKSSTVAACSTDAAVVKEGGVRLYALQRFE